MKQIHITSQREAELIEVLMSFLTDTTSQAKSLIRATAKWSDLDFNLASIDEILSDIRQTFDADLQGMW